MISKLGDTIYTYFIMYSPTTGAPTYADATPSGYVYRNGSTGGSTVTITQNGNHAGAYYASFSTVTFAVGDYWTLLVSGTVGGVSSLAVVREGYVDTYNLTSQVIALSGVVLTQVPVKTDTLATLSVQTAQTGYLTSISGNTDTLEAGVAAITPYLVTISGNTDTIATDVDTVLTGTHGTGLWTADGTVDLSGISGLLLYISGQVPQDLSSLATLTNQATQLAYLNTISGNTDTLESAVSAIPTNPLLTNDSRLTAYTNYLVSISGNTDSLETGVSTLTAYIYGISGMVDSVELTQNTHTDYLISISGLAQHIDDDVHLISGLVSAGLTPSGLWSYTGTTGVAMYDVLYYILGLTQHNFRIFPTTYDGTGHLTAAQIKIYPTATDCDNDTNILKTYNMTATYTGDTMNSYKVTE